jgi:hypothetical protein
MKEILEQYLAQTIGVNCRIATSFDAVTLIAVSETFFTLEAREGGQLHYPLSRIISIFQPKQPVSIPGSVPFTRNKLPLVVEINAGSSQQAFVGFAFSA